MQRPSHPHTPPGLHFLTKFDFIHFVDKIVAVLQPVAELGKAQGSGSHTRDTGAVLANSAPNGQSTGSVSRAIRLEFCAALPFLASFSKEKETREYFTSLCGSFSFTRDCCAGVAATTGECLNTSDEECDHVYLVI